MGLFFKLKKVGRQGQQFCCGHGLYLFALQRDEQGRDPFQQLSHKLA